MRHSVSLLLAFALLSACGKKPAEAKRCKTAADCDEGWLCLARKCADPRGSAVYTDPGNAVTPDKVADEVNETVDEHEKAIEDRIDRAEKEP